MLAFVELRAFSEEWHHHALAIDDLIAVQNMILQNPRAHPLIKGAGGLRKMRFSPAAAGKGKSGALRICYAYFEKHSMVLLVHLYAKTHREDLTPKEKKTIREVLAAVEKQLARRKI